MLEKVHLYRKVRQKHGIKFLFTISFIEFSLQVPLLQDVCKKNALLHVVMEGGPLWKMVYLLFHLVKAGDLTST